MTDPDEIRDLIDELNAASSRAEKAAEKLREARDNNLSANYINRLATAIEGSPDDDYVVDRIYNTAQELDERG